MKKIKRRELHFEEAIIDIIKDNNGNSKLVIEVIDDEYSISKFHTEIYINHFRIQDWRRKAIEGELVAHSNMEIEERQLIK